MTDELLEGRLWMSGVHGAVRDGPGMDVVVSLTRYDRGLLGEELAEVERRTWPIRDGPLPNLDDLHDVAEQTAADVREGRKVLIHCGSGINRSGLVAALVVREVNQLTGPAAVQLLERKTEGDVLRNRRFREYVMGLGEP